MMRFAWAYEVSGAYEGGDIYRASMTFESFFFQLMHLYQS